MASYVIAVATSASLPVAGGMTEMVNVTDARAMQAPGSVVLSPSTTRKAPSLTVMTISSTSIFARDPSSPSAAILAAPAEGPTKAQALPRVPADAARPAIPT